MNKDIKGRIQYLLNKKFPDFVGKAVYVGGQLYRMIRMPQRHIHPGKLNWDKCIYIIRQLPPAQGGVLCNYNYTIMQILYAHSRGWYAVVDMQNYKTIYSSKERINGSNNAWDYYFIQPDGISLEDAYRSKDVVLSSAYMSKALFREFHSLDESILKKKSEIAQSCGLNHYVIDFIRSNSANVLDAVRKSRVLGVYCRGTLYNIIKGHQKRPDVSEYVKNIHHFVKKSSYDNIFIVSDEQEYIDELVAVFPNALYVKHPRQKAFNVEETKTLQEVLPEREMSTNENLLWYLSDVYIFSNCKSILCTMNNGVYTAILWNGGQYEEIRFLGGKNETRKD